MNFWASLYERFRKDDDTYSIQPSEFGLRFFSAKHHLCQKTTTSSRLQLQYIILQMLVESGEAQSLKEGFLLEGDVATRLSMQDRLLLGLPKAWPGRFELKIEGKTTQSDFKISILLVRHGGEVVHHFWMEGPYLYLNPEEYYLPDAYQYVALRSVKDHENLSSDQRCESANIMAIYSLQEAFRNGVRINLRHFDPEKMEILLPEKVAITAKENANGGLSLLPDFCFDLSPDMVEERLGQLEGGTQSTLRVGKKIVLLDEKRAAAVQEILSCRVISAREKRQFLCTPSAYLNAALVDLETGFSIRMHGMEIFKKAYFGQTDESGLSWFGNAEQEGDVFVFSAKLPFIRNSDDVDSLERLVQEAVVADASHVDFKNRTILLAHGKDELDRIFQEMRQDIVKQERAGGNTAGTQTSPPPTQHITVAIDANDDYVPESLLVSNIKESELYLDDLYEDDLHYSFFDYQEHGTRWILGLIKKMMTQNRKHGYLGALLADDMGLGKTFMVLAALKVYQLLEGGVDKQKPILAVMPVVLLENWQEELKRVFMQIPFSDVIVLHADASLKKFRREGASREHLLCEGDEMPSLDGWRYALKVGSVFGTERLDLPGRLVLTNYDTLRDYQFSLCMVDWGVVIFDEAQEIKNPNTLKSRAAKGLKADFRLAVTGTPVENELTDFWSIFDTVYPGLLGAYQEFQRTYILPIRKADMQEYDKIRIEIGQQLRTRVGSLMLRRTKEENLKGLPQKWVHDGSKDKTYSICMENIQLECYDSVVSTVVATKKAGEVSQVKKIILSSLIKLRDISLHPDLLNGGVPSIPKTQKEAKTIIERSAKLRLLLKILDEIKYRNEKVIIFVVNKRLQRFLSIALGVLYETSISIVNGDTPSVPARSRRGKASRSQMIKEFEAQPGFGIICMSPLAAGVGLTIVGANNVIHLERHWNPAKEAQATDRVYRIGAKKDVHIYVPLLTHPHLKSFDVNLNELLNRKVDLKDAIVSSGELSQEAFDTENMFGTEIRDSIISENWLDSMTWQYFEALSAILVQKLYGGISYLTPQSGDLGADVLLVGGSENVVIQCKTSLNNFTDSNAVREPRGAAEEYCINEKMKFSKSILAINAPRVSAGVFKRAKKLNVTVWDRKEMAAFLEKFPVRYSEIVSKLEEPRWQI